MKEKEMDVTPISIVNESIDGDTAPATDNKEMQPGSHSYTMVQGDNDGGSRDMVSLQIYSLTTMMFLLYYLNVSDQDWHLYSCNIKTVQQSFWQSHR